MFVLSGLYHTYVSLYIMRTSTLVSGWPSHTRDWAWIRLSISLAHAQ